MTSSQWLGTSNQNIIQAFEQNGVYGLQSLANEQSYAASMASIGVQMKGIALQENFYWGANAGGTWNNPTRGSAWGIENRQLGLQHQSTMANFADQWERMNLQNDFSVRRESNQWERMQVSNNFNTWQMGQQYTQFQQRQAWAREDWQYQDTMRGLTNAWQMEDLSEAIRFSSGRERRQLIRQRDRAAITQNLEGEQIETTRERQEESWAQEDERFRKQKEYTMELQRLDAESFQLNREQRERFFDLDTEAYNRRVSEYEQEKELQDELRELQRKFQYDQLQLSKEAAGAQAAAAAAQKELNDAMLEHQKNQEKFYGTLGEVSKYDNAYRIATATKEMIAMMDGVNTYRIDRIIELIREIGQASVGNRNNQRWGGLQEE